MVRWHPVTKDAPPVGEAVVVTNGDGKTIAVAERDLGPRGTDDFPRATLWWNSDGAGFIEFEPTYFAWLSELNIPDGEGAVAD